MTVEGPAAVASRPPLHLLLVEDNPGDAFLVRELLPGAERGDFRVTHVTRLADALDRLANERVDIVILDLCLPDSTGLDTIARVRAAHAAVPVVVLTGREDPEAGVDAIRSGAQDFLQKGRVDQCLLERTLRYAVERHALEARLARSQKLEAVGLLAARVAHDFNNVLTVILGLSGLVLPDLADRELARRRVETIRRTADLASRLSRQVVIFARGSTAASVVLEPGATIDEMTSLLEAAVGRAIRLRVAVRSAGRVRCHPAHLEQVILNLVLNARDAMPSGGTLGLELEDVLVGADEAAAKGPPAGPCVVLTVRDTGHGMDAATRARAFEPFFTTKAGRGAGLGLATVHDVVSRSGGRIEIESEPGRGTTFRVWLPRVGEPLAATSRRAWPAPAAPASGTILLVEDDNDLREVIRDILALEGYDVLEAATGDAALALARERSRPLHLVLSDVELSDLSVGELVEGLARERPGLRIVCMSGHAHDECVLRGASPNPADFLPKPFDPATLVTKVRAALGPP